MVKILLMMMKVGKHCVEVTNSNPCAFYKLMFRCTKMLGKEKYNVENK